MTENLLNQGGDGNNYNLKQEILLAKSNLSNEVFLQNTEVAAVVDDIRLLIEAVSNLCQPVINVGPATIIGRSEAESPQVPPQLTHKKEELVAPMQKLGLSRLSIQMIFARFFGERAYKDPSTPNDPTFTTIL